MRPVIAGERERPRLERQREPFRCLPVSRRAAQRRSRQKRGESDGNARSCPAGVQRTLPAPSEAFRTKMSGSKPLFRA